MIDLLMIDWWIKVHDYTNIFLFRFLGARLHQAVTETSVSLFFLRRPPAFLQCVDIIINLFLVPNRNLSLSTPLMSQALCYRPFIQDLRLMIFAPIFYGNLTYFTVLARRSLAGR